MEWNKPDRKAGDDGTVTDDEIMEAQSVAEEAKVEYEEYSKEKTKSTLSIRDRLARHKNRIFTLEVDLGDGEEPLKLQVRRMTEKERAKYNKINFAKYGSFDELTPAQLQQLADQGYEIMAALVIDPKMTVEEWKEEVDKATLDYISSKVALMTNEVSDAILIEEFKKK